MNSEKKLSSEQHVEILKILKDRFDKNMNRHKGLKWSEIKEKLEGNAEKLREEKSMQIDDLYREIFE